MTGPDWQPTGELERGLLQARQQHDNDGALRLLAQADLLFPLGPADWITSEVSGQRCVVSFTSEAAMKRLLGQPSGHRTARFIELAATWPDESLWLAIDPGLPIEFFLPATVVVEIAELAARPATDLEHTLAAALAANDTESYARTLLNQEVVLPIVNANDSRDITDPGFPWWRVAPAGPIAVFTSERRMRDHVRGDTVVEARFADVAAAWPDPSVDLVIDPGLDFGGRLDGRAMTYLGGEVSRIERITTDAIAQAQARTDLPEPERFQWAQRLVAEQLAPPEPPADQIAVQVVISPEQRDRYLRHGHRRVAGLIHRRPHRALPLASLYERLGLLGDGSPFGAHDEVGYVLRWYESDLAAYSSPTMDGVEVPDGAALWLIERGGAERHLATYRSTHARWYESGVHN